MPLSTSMKERGKIKTGSKIHREREETRTNSENLGLLVGVSSPIETHKLNEQELGETSDARSLGPLRHRVQLRRAAINVRFLKILEGKK
jgi:hypothetical protein